MSDLGRRVQPGDAVAVDGKAVVRNESHTYLLYYKPRGLMCSRKDDQGRPLIYDKLDVGPAVQSVGRLDMESEGLLILTDDGALTRLLTNPANGVERVYRVRLTGEISLDTLERLRRGGIDMGEGDFSDPWQITVDAETGGHSWITVTIRRGRWREVRRTLAACGHMVRRLIRVQFGGLELDEEMPAGAWRRLTKAEVRQLQRAATLPNP